MNHSNRHIAVVCNYRLNPDRIGGMDRFFMRYDAFAKANNYKVTWFFSNDVYIDGYAELDVFPNPEQHVEQHFMLHLKNDNVEYTHVVTHFTSLCSSFHKQIKSYLPDSKLVVVDHNPRPLNGFSFKKKFKNRLKSLLYARYVDLFIGVSQYTVDAIVKDLGSHVKQKTIRVYNGIDVEAIPSITTTTRGISYHEKRPLRLIIVSHLRPSKGIQDALKALSILTKAGQKNINLDIYGEGPYEIELRQMTARYDIDQLVNFKGSSSNILSLLKDYDYLLQPTYMECFSLSILESLAANLPVITTTVGGNQEVITPGTNGYIFEPKDVNALVHILQGVVIGHLKINENTRALIEASFCLHLMVKEHFNLID